MHGNDLFLIHIEFQRWTNICPICGGLKKFVTRETRVSGVLTILLASERQITVVWEPKLGVKAQ